MGGVPSHVPRGRTRLGPSASVWLSLLLVGVIAVAASFAGASHLRGARFGVHRDAGGQQPGSPGQSQPGNPQHLKGLPVLHPPSQLGLWVAIVVLVVVVAAAAWLAARLWRRRRRRREGVLTAAAVETPWWKAAEAESDPDELVSGIEVAVNTLDEQREPTDAIVRAWLALEAAAEASGVVRRDAETPTEFTRRAMQRAFSDDRAIHTLLGLYLRTRFGDRSPTESDVVVVREALSRLLAGRRGRPISAGSDR